MAGASIDITAQVMAEPVERAFTRLVGVMANTTPVMAAIGTGLVGSTHRRFVSQTAPGGAKWAANQPGYAAIKRNRRILTESGRLRDSINARPGPDWVRVGTNVIYAAVHQFGATIRPKNASHLVFRLASGTRDGEVGHHPGAAIPRNRRRRRGDDRRGGLRLRRAVRFGRSSPLSSSPWLVAGEDGTVPATAFPHAVHPPASVGMMAAPADRHGRGMDKALNAISRPLDDALAAGTAGAPEWLHLVPAGTFSGADGRGPFVVPDPAALIAATHGRKLPIDENHAIDLVGAKGGASPARGWVVELQNRDDGIWGRVEWTDEGKRLVEGRAYGFLSPVFLHTRSKPHRIARLERVALTNDPNITDLKSLHAKEEAKMEEELRQALGLDNKADASAIVEAVKTLHAAFDGACRPDGEARRGRRC